MESTNHPGNDTRYAGYGVECAFEPHVRLYQECLYAKTAGCAPMLLLQLISVKG